MDSLPTSRFYSAQRLDLFVQCVRLIRLSVGFRTHSKSLQFQFNFNSLDTAARTSDELGTAIHNANTRTVVLSASTGVVVIVGVTCADDR